MKANHKKTLKKKKKTLSFKTGFYSVAQAELEFVNFLFQAS